jgi:hypothetical protein
MSQIRNRVGARGRSEGAGSSGSLSGKDLREPQCALQIPPLRSPGFPVESRGVDEVHAALSTESRTRGRCEQCEVGNPGTLGRDDNSVAGSDTVPLHLSRPLQNCHPDRIEAQWRDLLFRLRPGGFPRPFKKPNLDKSAMRPRIENRARCAQLRPRPFKARLKIPFTYD